MLVSCILHEPIHYLLARRVLFVELYLLIDEFIARLGYKDTVMWVSFWRKLPGIYVHI